MSNKIHIAKCKACGEPHELLDDYLYYLKQYLKMEKRAVVPCRHCALPLNIKHMATEREQYESQRRKSH